jgi:hypothetical protein
MPDATTTAIITEKAMSEVIIMGQGTNAGTIMEKASSAVTRRAMMAAAAITGTDQKAQ